MDCRRGVVCFVVVVFLVSACHGVSAASEWPTFKQNNERTGYQPGPSNYPLSDIVLLWNYSTKGAVKSSPAAADLNGDGKLEVVFGSDDGFLYALDYQGRQVWNYSAGSRIRASPTIANLTSYGGRQVLFGADNGIVYALNASGSLLWSYATNGSVTTSPLVENFDSMPEREVLVTSADELIYALNYLGELKDTYKTSGPITSSPAAGDINGDGKKEIIFGSDDSILYVLSYPLSYKVWQYQTNGEIAITPAVSDYDGDGKVEVIVASQDSIVRPVYWGTALSVTLEKECKVVGWTYKCEIPSIGFTKFFEDWNATVGSKIYSSPSVADFSGKYKKDIVFGTEGHSIFILDAAGKRVGGYTTNKPVRSTPAIADLNGDRIPEVLFGSDDGGVYVVDYPYFFSLTYTVGYNESSRGMHAGLAKMGGDALLLAEKIGENATIRTESEGVWQIIRLVGTKEQKVGTISFKEALGEIEVLAGERRMRFDAKKTDSILRVYQYPNRRRYHYQTLGPVRSSPAVADLNNDKHLEFLIASDDGALYAFGSGIEYARTEANEYLVRAESMYTAGRRDKAAEYAAKAIELHGSINDSSGLSRDNALVKRLEADEILAKAHEMYNQSLVNNASDYLTEAALIYASINYTRYGDDIERLSDLLEAELYYREAQILYASGDLENASQYASKAAELFRAYNNSLSLNRTKFLYEVSREHAEADRHYVAALNLFFTEGYSGNVTAELERARAIYQDINASDSIALVDTMLQRVKATKLTDDAYALRDEGNITEAYELGLQAITMFQSINYTAGLYRAEALVNDTQEYSIALNLYENARVLYTAGDLASAIDDAQKAKSLFARYNDSLKVSDVESFVAKSRLEYTAKVKRPRYLIILFNVMVGVFSGIMLVLSAEKLLRDRRLEREKRDSGKPGL